MAGLTLQNNAMVRVASVDGPVHAGLLERLGQLRAAGASHAEQEAALPSRLTPSMNRVYYRTYRTKDSTIAVACVSPGLQRALMRALGLTDSAHARPLPDVAAQTAHYAEFGARVEALLASRTTADWKAVLDAHGVPASAVRFPQEMLDDEQVLANRMLHDLEHPALGTVRVLAPPVSMDRGGFQSAAGHRRRSGPRPGSSSAGSAFRPGRSTGSSATGSPGRSGHEARALRPAGGGEAGRHRRGGSAARSVAGGGGYRPGGPRPRSAPGPAGPRARAPGPRARPAAPRAPLAGIGKIVCIGLNYTDHAAEVGSPLPSEPLVFIKATSALAGPGDPIVRPRGATKLDYEVELAAVIGREARDVDEAVALRYVAAYAVMNDVSEREFQMERGGTTTKGKSADTFAPLGPWLVTADEVPDPQALALWTRVNGETRQDGNTANMVFPVAQLVSYVSRFMSLQPGDVISTGTPAGVGHGHRPPRYLHPGDVVEMGIAGLGAQRSAIVAAEARSRRR